MTRRVMIQIAADGTITAESAGVPGPKCVDDVALLQNLCGGAIVVDSRLTASYYKNTSMTEDAPTQQTEEA